MGCRVFSGSVVAAQIQPGWFDNGWQLGKSNKWEHYYIHSAGRCCTLSKPKFFGPLLGLNPKLKTLNLNPKYRFGVPASGFRLSSGFRDLKS